MSFPSFELGPNGKLLQPDTKTAIAAVTTVVRQIGFLMRRTGDSAKGPSNTTKKQAGFGFLNTTQALAKRRSLGLFGGDPVVDALVEDAQRQGAVPQDFVVERAEVKVAA